MGYKIDLTGKPFELLVVVSFDYDKNKWKCKCACGNFCYVSGRDLRSKNTRSCGCIRSTSTLAELEELTGISQKTILYKVNHYKQSYIKELEEAVNTIITK